MNPRGNRKDAGARSLARAQVDVGELRLLAGVLLAVADRLGRTLREVVRSSRR